MAQITFLHSLEGAVDKVCRENPGLISNYAEQARLVSELMGRRVSEDDVLAYYENDYQRPQSKQDLGMLPVA